MPVLIDENGNSEVNLELPQDAEIKEEKKEPTEGEKIQEMAVENARNRLLPYLKEKNLKIKDLEWMLGNIGFLVESAVYTKVSKFNIKDIGLLEVLKDEYPHVDHFRAILEAYGDVTATEATLSFQWFAQLIKKTIQEENKDREFNDLKIDF